MKKEEYTKKLEGVIKGMLAPLKGIPFNLVIESVCNHCVIEFDKDDSGHKRVLQNLKKAMRITCKNVNVEGIKRSRPNEVGNDIELFVMEALEQCGVTARRPLTEDGKQKSAGYPDIEIATKSGDAHYVECKTFRSDTLTSTLRSFYLSPSEDFKITHDAIHFIVAFEIYEAGREGDINIYKTKAWKILDAYHLECDVKHEFNSDNLRLYQPSMILAQGKA